MPPKFVVQFRALHPLKKNDMRFAHILSAVYDQPWNITHSGWMSVHELLQSKLFSVTDIKNVALSDFVNARPEMSIDENGIAHIYVTGVLGKNLSVIEKSCGNTGYEQIVEDFSNAETQGAKGVLFYVDSPGGAASGNVETAQFISNSTIPVVAFADGMMASAAYALAIGASKIFASPSAMVGSIGTIIPLVDRSGEWAQKGLKPAYVTHTGGDLKDAFHPPAFSETHMAHIQQIVDDTFALFRNHVLAHRAISPDAMRGQVFVGQRALEANLIDALGTEQDAYDELVKIIR